MTSAYRHNLLKRVRGSLQPCRLLSSGLSGLSPGCFSSLVRSDQSASYSPTLSRSVISKALPLFFSFHAIHIAAPACRIAAIATGLSGMIVELRFVNLPPAIFHSSGSTLASSSIQCSITECYRGLRYESNTLVIVPTASV